MIISRNKVNGKEVRSYQIKVSKKELQDLITDILGNFKLNKGLTIEVK